MTGSKLRAFSLLAALCSLPASARELSFVEAEVVPPALPSACTDVSLADVAVSPGGGNVYVLWNVCIGDDQVLTYAAGADGALSLVDAYPVDANPNVLAMAPDGSVLFYGTNNGAIGALLRNQTTGLLNFADQQNDGVLVDHLQFTYGLAVSPDGRHLYATGGENAVTTFAWSATAHTLTPVDVDVSGDAGLALSVPTSIAVTPGGEFVVVASTGDSHLVVFDRSSTTGEITRSQDFFDAVGGVDGLSGPSALAVAPTGSGATASLYLSSFDTSNLVRFDQGPAGQPPAFSFFGAQDVGALPQDLVIRNDGARLFVADSALNAVTAIERDRLTGALGVAVDSIADDDVGVNGLGGVTRIDSSGRYLYALSSNDDAIAVIDTPEPGGMALDAAVLLALAGCGARRPPR